MSQKCCMVARHRKMKKINAFEKITLVCGEYRTWDSLRVSSYGRQMQEVTLFDKGRDQAPSISPKTFGPAEATNSKFSLSTKDDITACMQKM